MEDELTFTNCVTLAVIGIFVCELKINIEQSDLQTSLNGLLKFLLEVFYTPARRWR